jgi:hypothetical protein
MVPLSFAARLRGDLLLCVPTLVVVLGGVGTALSLVTLDLLARPLARLLGAGLGLIRLSPLGLLAFTGEGATGGGSEGQLGTLGAVYCSFKFIFILLHDGDLAIFCVSPWVVTSLTFLGVDLVLGLVTTLLWAMECSSFSLGFTFSSLTTGGGGGGGESRSQEVERVRR